jgi:hypothetical protein
MMRITRRDSAQKLIDYLHHKMTLAELVDWAETAIMEAEFEREHLEVLREIVARVGLADVRAFGLTWDDCEDFLSRLGYKVSVSVAELLPGR